MIITERSEIGRHLDLEQQELVLVGRDLICTFPVADKSVSRRHLQLKSIAAAKNHMAIDFGSSNGTFINEVRISQPIEVKDGDVICIGDTVMI